MPVAVALLAVKALASCAGLPRDLIVHGAAFLASFAARVALALAFLMLSDNKKRCLIRRITKMLVFSNRTHLCWVVRAAGTMSEQLPDGCAFSR